MVMGIYQEPPFKERVPPELKVDKRYIMGFGLINRSTVDEQPYPTSFRVEAEIHIPIVLGLDWTFRRVYTTPKLEYGGMWAEGFLFTIPRTYAFRTMIGRDGTATVRAFVAGKLAEEIIGSFRTIASPVLV